MVEVHQAALKHGLDPGQVERLWSSWVEQCWLDDDQPGRVLRFCMDDAGRAFELIGLVFDDQRVLVIHAMRLRPSTVELMRRNR